MGGKLRSATLEQIEQMEKEFQAMAPIQVPPAIRFFAVSACEWGMETLGIVELTLENWRWKKTWHENAWKAYPMGRVGHYILATPKITKQVVGVGIPVHDGCTLFILSHHHPRLVLNRNMLSSSNRVSNAECSCPRMAKSHPWLATHAEFEWKVGEGEGFSSLTMGWWYRMI